ncbi:MAG: RagB/SusD family nutrient uptake outer membrane protein [Prevotellaceae bacterium]|nr:RagB/SusD family nutrient uptake outer membrane protein [Prevotellaceae bacterium]
MSLGCTRFLDLVPDSQLTLEMIFTMKEDAWNALAKVYSYMPHDEIMDDSSWLLGDEFMSPEYEQLEKRFPPMKIMRGDQNASDPQLGYWQGSGGAPHLYSAIRTANIFIEKINEVTDMSQKEIAEWKAQAKFLKAYYHFLLLRSYGPIIISDKAVSADAVGDDMYQKRSKVDDCFDYIVRTINEAIPDLKPVSSATEVGQVNQVVAKSIKARILLYRASPFYSGNRDYYEDFLDFDGKPYFAVYDQPEDTRRKWKDALDAIDTAIVACRKVGVAMYEYEKPVFVYDRGDVDTVPNRMKTLYDLRMILCDPWNKELIWGLSNVTADSRIFSNYTNIAIPPRFAEDLSPHYGYSDCELSVSYHMIETYYTKNGLLPSEDKTFRWASRHNIVEIPAKEFPEYDAEYRGYLQPGAQTIYYYLNREPRFYANLGITGGYWRTHEVRYPTDFLADGVAGGRYHDRTNNYLYTGIGVQKFTHPQTKEGHWMRVVMFPYPLIRLADLYLMKAEAMNEYLDAPNQEVWDAVNIIRTRAGIPTVEAAWGGQNAKAEAFNKHINKEGMRQIIKQERAVELAFEGLRFWDLLRWKDAVAELSKPVIGWMAKKTTVETFFVQEVKQTRRFSFRDCLTPIHVDELNRNSNLKQNPGW